MDRYVSLLICRAKIFLSSSVKRQVSRLHISTGVCFRSTIQTARHYKFYRVQKDLASMNQARAFVTCIVNAGEHSHIALLCQWKDLSVHGVYDTVNKSVRLVWTDDEWFIKDLRSLESNRYVFYRFPIVQDRPLFMYTQALCSKWYKWQKQFNEADGILKSFNALERYLYKEPEIPNLNINNGHS